MNNTENGPGTDDRPLATVVIPNWNGMRWLPKCIEALEKQTVSCFEILVVENASTDGSLAWLQKHGVPYLKNDRNLGFAGGVNAGIRAVLCSQRHDAPGAGHFHDR